jgi:hypothetical protein
MVNSDGVGAVGRSLETESVVPSEPEPLLDVALEGADVVSDR